MPTVDLHTASSPGDADMQLEKALFFFVSHHEQACRVVHGIGEGVLTKMVHRVLTKNPLVEDFQLSADGGSTIVLLGSIR